MVWIYIFSKCNRLQLCLQFRCSLDVSTYGFLCCLNTMEIRSFLELFKSFKRSNKHFERVSRFFFHVFFFSRFFFHIFFSCFQRLNKFNIFFCIIAWETVIYSPPKPLTPFPHFVVTFMSVLV